jgi:hypothetical protein
MVTFALDAKKGANYSAYRLTWLGKLPFRILAIAQ